MSSESNPETNLVLDLLDKGRFSTIHSHLNMSEAGSQVAALQHQLSAS